MNLQMNVKVTNDIHTGVFMKPERFDDFCIDHSWMRTIRWKDKPTYLSTLERSMNKDLLQVRIVWETLSTIVVAQYHCNIPAMASEA